MILHTLFPTPVVVRNFEPSNELVSFFNSLEVNKRFDENTKNEMIVRKYYGHHTNNIQILKEKECSELRKFILSTALEFSNEVMCYKCKELTDTISWLSIKAPGEQHIPHTHPNSFISGVYYYEDVPETTPLIFKKGGTKSETTFQMIPPFDREKSRQNPLATEEYGILPKKGDLVLFPSYLLHYVPVNSSAGNRGGLAINIMPMYNLGENEHLTMFNYQDGFAQH